MGSSWITGHAYDAARSTLTIHTATEAIVVPEVYQRHYDAFRSAPSQGRYYHQHFAKRARKHRGR